VVRCGEWRGCGCALSIHQAGSSFPRPSAVLPVSRADAACSSSFFTNNLVMPGVWRLEKPADRRSAQHQTGRRWHENRGFAGKKATNSAGGFRCGRGRRLGIGRCSRFFVGRKPGETKRRQPPACRVPNRPLQICVRVSDGDGPLRQAGLRHLIPPSPDSLANADVTWRAELVRSSGPLHS